MGGGGGASGAGSGAPGGPSICIAYTTSTGAPTQNQNSCTRVGGGTGGAGGYSSVLGQAPSGGTGLSADAYGF